MPFRAPLQRDTTNHSCLFDLGVPLRGPRSVSQSPGYLSRDPRLAPAARRTQTTATTTATDALRSILLDNAPAGLAAVVRRSGHRKARTVIAWHRTGFRLCWRWRSRGRRGRPKISAEIRNLIGTMAVENVGWGAPKIHGELLKLGFAISECTVARYLRRLRRRGDPGHTGLRFSPIIVRQSPQWISLPFRQ